MTHLAKENHRDPSNLLYSVWSEWRRKEQLYCSAEAGKLCLVSSRKHAYGNTNIIRTKICEYYYNQWKVYCSPHIEWRPAKKHFDEERWEKYVQRITRTTFKSFNFSFIRQKVLLEHKPKILVSNLFSLNWGELDLCDFFLASSALLRHA